MLNDTRLLFYFQEIKMVTVLGKEDNFQFVSLKIFCDDQRNHTENNLHKIDNRYFKTI